VAKANILNRSLCVNSNIPCIFTSPFKKRSKKAVWREKRRVKSRYFSVFRWSKIEIEIAFQDFFEKLVFSIDNFYFCRRF
jgi:hypothetical protein